jgi:hypothetical protein
LAALPLLDGVAFGVGVFIGDVVFRGAALAGAGLAALGAAVDFAGGFTARLLWVPVGCMTDSGAEPVSAGKATGAPTSARECTGKPRPKPIH